MVDTESHYCEGRRRRRKKKKKKKKKNGVVARRYHKKRARPRTTAWGGGFVFLAGWNVVFEARAKGRFDVPMYFDRLVSDDYAVSKKKIGKRDARVCGWRDEQKQTRWCALPSKRRTLVPGTRTERGGKRRTLELETLSRMRHPNIVGLIAAYQTSSELQLVMEKIDGKGLISYLVECDAEVRAARKRKNSNAREVFVDAAVVRRGGARAREERVFQGLAARERDGYESRTKTGEID